MPLADEINIIRRRWPRFMIMVDDFQVPAAGYYFDRYPSGLELTLDYLVREGVDLASMAVLFPTATSSAETSVRRGTLVLTSPELYEQSLSKERLLFRFAAA